METQSLHEQISYIASQLPDKIAIEWGNARITYQELEERTNQIANFFATKPGLNVNIPVMLENSIELIEAIIGIIKTGGVFAPIDPGFPENRIKLMIDKIDADWIITCSCWLEKLNQMMTEDSRKINVLVLDLHLDDSLDVQPLVNLNVYAFDSNLNRAADYPAGILNKHCYIYFTSGSTGEPKAVLGRHRSLKHFIDWEIKEFAIDQSFRVSQIISPSFDPFLRDVFVPLCSGATLVIPENREMALNPMTLKEWIDISQITLMHMVPTMFKTLISEIENPDCFFELKYILLAGELVRGNDIKKFFELFGSRIQLINMYGPTETTLAKLFYRIKEDDTNKVSVPVGKPISGAQAMILNSNLEKCAVGSVGEIYIRTPYTSSGYYNDRELSREVFIQNPFNNNPQDIIYKTGDLGIMLPSGDIEIVGRVDNQVKLRGVRIELGEIENILLQVEPVTEVVVVAREDERDNKLLCAYLVSYNTLNIEKIREHLTKQLPDYMVPSHFIQIEKMPLTPNGKIDRKALPAPENAPGTGVEYVPPENQIEEKLAKIWTEIFRIEEIGVNHNFFELGGHSVRAILMVARIQRELDVEVPLKEIFLNPTIKKLATYIGKMNSSRFSTIQPTPKRQYYPISSAQKRLYIMNQLEGPNTTYNISRVILLEGPLNYQKLEHSFKRLVNRHETLRTSFASVGGEIVQKIEQEVEVKLTHLNITETGLPQMVKDFIQPFDLSKAPLFRGWLARLGEECHALFFDMHHIISDGVSISNLIKEIVDLYQGKELEPLTIQYKDFAVWQNKLFTSDEIKEQQKYWLDTFKGEIPVLSLPTDFPHPPIRSYRGGSVAFELGEWMTGKLKTLAKETKSTLFMVLLACYNVLLAKYSGQEDIVVGSPIAGRHYAGTEKIIGMFLNTLALRNYPKATKTFKEFVAEVRDNVLKAYDNQDYQFEQLVEELNIPRDLSRSPLFDVMFVMQDPDQPGVMAGDLKISPYRFDINSAKYDLIFYAIEDETKIRCLFNFRTDLFDRETVQAMSSSFKELLTMILRNPEEPIYQIGKVRISEVSSINIEYLQNKNLLNEYADDLSLPLLNEYMKDLSIERIQGCTLENLFYQNVQKYPENIAIECGHRKITYRELDQKSNAIANSIIEMGLVKGTRVGIMTHNPLEMIISILSILKSGLIFIPFDLTYPEKRLERLLQIAEPGLILTNQSNLKKTTELAMKAGLPGIVLEIIDTLEQTGNRLLASERPDQKWEADDDLYIYFTSGSTGQPKGIIGRYQGLLHFCLWEKEKLNLNNSSRISQLSSPAFDPYLRDIFVPLIAGGTICVPEEKEILLNGKKLVQWIDQSKVSLIHCVPSVFKLLNQADLSPDMINNLQYILLAGERVTPQMLKDWYQVFDQRIQLLNVYGPTEVTLFKACYFIKKTDCLKRTIPVGQAIEGSQIMILDEEKNLCLPGISGEIYIRTPYRSKGYFKNPELTAKSFVQNPFNDASEDLLYKTGDLGRILFDGNVELIGRIDNQVKVRGVRIEPGEIENTLLKHSAVLEAVVIDRQDTIDEVYLTAYLVLKEATTALELRDFLSGYLPEYMIPGYFVILEKMPLSPNGKIDYQALPEPESNLEVGVEYVPPSTSTEVKLSKIWSKILNRDKIGVNDNFFLLGGHSLKATTLVSQIYKELNVELPLRTVFMHQTVGKLARLIEESKKSTYFQINPVGEEEYYPVSSAQKRLYIIQQLESRSISYNMPKVLTLNGELDIECLTKAFQDLIQRHEILRTSFEKVDDDIVQRVHQKVEFTITYLEAEEIELSGIVKRFVQPFDLSCVPLMRVGLMKLAENRHVLLVDMHHIISDGRSFILLVKEFADLYEGKSLSPLRLQYKDFAVWQNKLFTSGVMKAQEKFWLDTFKTSVDDQIPVLNLLTDYPRPPVHSFEGSNLYFELNEDLTRGLNNLARETDTTLFMLLLAGFYILLARYSGQEDIVIGSPISGRQHPDLAGLVGIFVNTLALRNSPQGDKSFKEFLSEVKENVLGAFDNQNYQFEELVDKLDIPKDLSRHPLFDVVFNMQEPDQTGVTAKGLQVEPYNLEERAAKYDLTLFAFEGNKVKCTFNFCTALFKKKTIEQFAASFIEILAEIVAKPEIRIKQIGKIVPDNIQYAEEFSKDLTIKDIQNHTLEGLFYKNVDKVPDKNAIEYGSKRLSYAELDRRSNILANSLCKSGLSKDSRIGIMTYDPLEIITGILGILKSGYIFVPFDLSIPAKRLESLLRIADLKLILTDEKSLAEVKKLTTNLNSQMGETSIDIWFVNQDGKSVNVLGVDYQDIGFRKAKCKGSKKDNSETIGNIDLQKMAERPEILHQPDDSIYIYFTSGSTGEPKGIVGSYQGLLHFIFWEITQLKLTEDCRVSQLSSPAFDAFLRDIFVPLTVGGTICVPEDKDEVLFGERLVSWLDESSINLIHCVPSIFKLINQVSLEPTMFEKLEYILMSGERITTQIIDYWYGIFGDRIQLVNLYGPTETTMVKTCYFMKPGDRNLRIIPVGKAIEGSQIMILDEARNLCKSGIIGEIYIRTPYRSKGYFNRPELTAEVFVPNPFNHLEEEYLYKTGDLGRILPDGNLEFIGRIDHQVKIRGVRIEPGEIENVLLKHPKVQETVVIDRKDTDHEIYLVAYLVSKTGVNTIELREFMTGYLPEYMIPQYFISLNKIPLTPSGKVDYQLLPTPEAVTVKEMVYQAPQTNVEIKLAKLWSEILHQEKIGVNDDFFLLGGHSLKAIMLINKIHKELNVELSLKTIFTHPTIASLAKVIQDSRRSDFVQIERIEEREYYPLSSAQKRLYILHQLESNSTGYNMPKIMYVNGKLDIQRITDVFNHLIERHQSLRTSFVLINGEVQQKVHSEVEFEVRYSEANGEILGQLIKQFVRPFDLQKAPLLRVELVKLSDTRHVLMVDIHHIVSDGTSVGILVKEFISLYSGNKLPGLSVQYKDFAVWQNKLFKDGTIKEQEEFWLDVFAGEIPVLDMPTDYPRPVIQSFRGDQIRTIINDELSLKLKELATRTGSTMYMVLAAVFNILLYKYTGQEDIIIGSPTAGRRHADLQNVIGMFVNTLAMRNRPTGYKTFIEFLNEVKENTIKAYDNEDYQFEELVEKLKLQRDLSRNPLFDVMFSVKNFDREAMKTEGLEFIPYSSMNFISKFDLTLDAMEEKDHISFNLEYCIDLFKKERMERLLNHYVNILRQIAIQPEIKVSEIDILSELEKNQILNEFNATRMEYANQHTIHDLFVKQAKRTPDRLALVFGEQKMTYKELHIKSNQLAHLLKNYGVKEDEIVGIMAERSIVMVIGIFGILKAGGAYMPIDPEYPEERIKYMLDDSNTRILLMDEENDFKHTSVPEILINLTEYKIYANSEDDLQNGSKPGDLAYIMYTSGSTGKPKGVMLEHKGVVSLSRYYDQLFCFETNTRMVHMSNVSFDGSIVEIFPPLLYGATVHILRKEIALDRKEFIQYLWEQRINIAQFVPVTLKELLTQDNKIPSLQAVLVAGDRLEDSLKDQILSLGYQLTNHYGPTEGTVDSVVAKCERNRTTIGKPIANTRVYILDKDQNLVPIGVPGELCIAGVGLARGYLNKPELTAERFIEHPQIPGERIYLTGDLASWQADGNITFIGRKDYQVKIRGYRVEPGEVESHLLSHDDVKDAVVIDKVDTNGVKYLCAYIVAREETLTATELREFLLKELPDYMIPSYFVQVTSLPITSSGKVDRNSLPDPEGGMELGLEYMAPTDEVQEILVTIFEEVLGVKGIGITHNFFDVGGHSLKAMILTSRIHKELNVEVPLSQVFKFPTIKELAGYIFSKEKNLYSSIKPVKEREYYPASSAQKRLYIPCQFKEAGVSYNMPGALVIEGTLDIARLELIFQKLVKRHETFRTSFDMVDEEIVQIVHQDVELTLNYIEADEGEVAGLLPEFIKPFDLSKPPLLRVTVIKIAEDRYILFYDMHHIISDGVSASILTREFISLYEGQELPSLNVQYKDFAVWQNELFENGVMAKQQAYWLETFAKKIPLLKLPTDYPRPEVQSFEGSKISFEIDTELTAKLKRFTREKNVTLYMVLLAGLNVLLSKYTGQEDIVVGTPIAGRPHADLQTIIGIFVNTLTMRNYPQTNQTFEEFLQSVKVNTLKAYENQDYPFELLVEQLGIPRDVSRNPLFDVVFVLQNTDNETRKIPGLKFSPYSFEHTVAKFDLTFVAKEVQGKIQMNLIYSTYLFKQKTMERLSKHLIHIINQIVNNPTTKLVDITLFSREEREELLSNLQHSGANDHVTREKVAKVNEIASAKEKQDNIEADFDF